MVAAQAAPPPEEEPRSSFADTVRETNTNQIKAMKEPSSYKGEPALIYTDHEISLLSSPLRFALVGKFTAARPSMEFLRRGFKTIGFKGDFRLGMMDDRHILIRFDLEEDYHRCWLHRSWRFQNHTMHMLKWTPEFSVKEEPPVVPVWVSLEQLPLFLFARGPLFSIGRLIGNPLKIDAATLLISRPSMARICVEIDLRESLPSRIWIGLPAGGFWQPIVYENLPNYCFDCRSLRHSQGECGKQIIAPERQEWRPKAQNNTTQHSKIQPDPTTPPNNANVQFEHPQKDPPVQDQQTQQEAPAYPLESAVETTKKIPEVNPSVFQLENEFASQKKLDLVSAVEPVNAGGSPPTNVSYPLDDKSSPQTIRQNGSEANFQNSGSTNHQKVDHQSAQRDPPSAADHLLTATNTDDERNTAVDIQLDATNIETGLLQKILQEVITYPLLGSPQSALILDPTSQSTLNPHATEFVRSSVASPVPSAPSPVASCTANGNFNDVNTTSLSAPTIMESKQLQPIMMSPMGLQIHYPTFDHSQEDWESLHSSEQDEENEDEEFWDRQLVRDESYLDHKKELRKSRERERLEVQFRRGRGRPSSSRQTYFDAMRTNGTRSASPN